MEIDINELINNLIQKIAILELENSKKDILINQLQNEVNNKGETKKNERTD